MFAAADVGRARLANAARRDLAGWAAAAAGEQLCGAAAARKVGRGASRAAFQSLGPLR